MNKIILCTIAIAVCSISAYKYGFANGYQSGLISCESKKDMQIECLKEMWGETLTLEQHQKIQSLKNDPEAVRSYLVDILRKDGWYQDNIITEAVELKKGESIEDISRTNMFKPRAALLLTLWKIGQTDILQTDEPKSYSTSQKSERPLWKVYLKDPTTAWKRGVDQLGKNGK